MSTLEQQMEHRLGPVTRIPVGEGREFEVAGRSIAVFRLRSGSVAATDARCPHKGGPLADGIVGMDSIICPLHNWRFSLHGGEALSGECGVATHRVRVDEEGELHVVLADHGD